MAFLKGMQSVQRGLQMNGFVRSCAFTQPLMSTHQKDADDSIRVRHISGLNSLTQSPKSATSILKYHPDMMQSVNRLAFSTASGDALSSLSQSISSNSTLTPVDAQTAADLLTNTAGLLDSHALSLFLFSKYNSFVHAVPVLTSLVLAHKFKNYWFLGIPLLAYSGMVPLSSGIVGAGTGLAVVLPLAFGFQALFAGRQFRKKALTLSMMPSGTPMYIAGLLPAIELVSYAIRPITLSLRILINLSVGHIFMSFFHSMNTVVPGGVMMLYEFCVVAIQAVILTRLIQMYRK